MAVGDTRLAISIRAELWRWRWVLGFIAVSLLLRSWVPAQLPVSQTVDLLAGDEWYTSPGMQAAGADERRRAWRAATPVPAFASRALVDISEGADFLQLRACAAEAVPDDGAHLMLASQRRGVLDFNRQYSIYSFPALAPGECASDALPRRAEDGAAVVQLQLEVTGTQMALEELTVTPLRENPRWRVLRYLALTLGIILLLPLFAAYRSAEKPWQAVLGLLGVAAILFGCLVSVPLKADIFALISGGRELATTANPQSLLRSAFPVGGFSIFTLGHAVLFAGAAFFLAQVNPRAWVDFLLLGVTTETLQIYVPGRGPGLFDIAVDWSGVLLAALLLALLRLMQRVGLIPQ